MSKTDTHEHCAQVVGNGHGRHRCAKPGTVHEEGKWWCAIHTPSAKLERTRAKLARWNAEADTVQASMDEGRALLAALGAKGRTQSGPGGGVGKPHVEVVLTYDEARALLARIHGGAR